MKLIDTIDEILSGDKSLPVVNVAVDTVSICKAAGVLLMAGVMFLLIQKLLKK